LATHPLPDPLLPPVDDGLTSDQTGASGTIPTQNPAGLSDSAASQEPNEVHVHIGRIEVTATTQAAPSGPKTRESTPPLSLDDYLARRQREQS